MDGVDIMVVCDVLEEFENEICLVICVVFIKWCVLIGGDFVDFAVNNFMVCCASWDRDGELFVMVGMSKFICVYEMSVVMILGVCVYCLVVEFEVYFKVLVLCYNSYVK